MTFGCLLTCIDAKYRQEVLKWGDPIFVFIANSINHSIHVNRGVSCVECHGRIDKMEVVHHDKPLSMAFCLDCHRNPEDSLRPMNEVTNLGWSRHTDSNVSTLESIHSGLKIKHNWGINPPLSCTGCHR